MSIGASGGAGGYGKFMIGSLAASYVVTVGKAETRGSQFIIEYYHNRLLAEQHHWAQSQPLVAQGLRWGYWWWVRRSCWTKPGRICIRIWTDIFQAETQDMALR
jgi:hypothetical protein